MTIFIQGTSGDDSILGSDADESIFVQGGNDTVDGGAGNDTIGGAAGGDTLRGGSGNDEIFGAGGDDSISGGTGTDTLFGGSGNDFISASDDIVYGGTGNDRIFSSGDNVFVFGDSHGSDSISFNKETDTFLFTGSIEPDDLFVVGRGARNPGADGVLFTIDDFFPQGFTLFTGQGSIDFSGSTDAILIDSGLALSILNISFDDSIL